jgi:hypothetical protein
MFGKLLVVTESLVGPMNKPAVAAVKVIPDAVAVVVKAA